MYLFESLPWYTILMGLAVLAGLMLFNELARANKWIALGLFLVLPIILTFWVGRKQRPPEQVLEPGFIMQKYILC